MERGKGMDQQFFRTILFNGKWANDSQNIIFNPEGIDFACSLIEIKGNSAHFFIHKFLLQEVKYPSEVAPRLNLITKKQYTPAVEFAFSDTGKEFVTRVRIKDKSFNLLFFSIQRDYIIITTEITNQQEKVI
jgi:hypothetical protein